MDAAAAAAVGGRRKSQMMAPMMGLIAAKRMSRRWIGRVGRDSSVASAAPAVKLENTYRLEPKMKFETSAANRIMKEQLETTLADRKYSADASASLSKALSESIKNRLKSELNFERYRLVVMVTLAESAGQGVTVASRCVWNEQFDTSVTANYTSRWLGCTATVFAVTME